MEKVKVENPRKGLITSIVSSILTTAGIILCILWGVMVKEHFELQATAEDFEGLGSIGIIIVGLIFAVFSLICVVVSSIFSITTVIRASKQFRLIGIILCVINCIVIIGNIIIFIVLKLG